MEVRGKGARVRRVTRKHARGRVCVWLRVRVLGIEEGGRLRKFELCEEKDEKLVGNRMGVRQRIRWKAKIQKTGRKKTVNMNRVSRGYMGSVSDSSKRKFRDVALALYL